MTDGKTHISSYLSHVYVLITLLILTTLSVVITGIHLGAFTVAVALLIASVKVGIVITWFMHMKFESMFLRLMIIGVFVIFALVTGITFVDYLFR